MSDAQRVAAVLAVEHAPTGVEDMRMLLEEFRGDRPRLGLAIIDLAGFSFRVLVEENDSTPVAERDRLIEGFVHERTHDPGRLTPERFDDLATALRLVSGMVEGLPIVPFRTVDYSSPGNALRALYVLCTVLAEEIAILRGTATTAVYRWLALTLAEDG